MQLLNLIQGTLEWKAFRGSHICASDAITIMGRNPWRSLNDLYQEKLFGMEQAENPYMTRGKNLEPVALECFEKETGLTMFPMVFKHRTLEWMGVSYDGITIQREAIVEIKCPGRKDHTFAETERKPPFKYYPQLQHQIFMANLTFAYYYSFDGEKGFLLEVKRDPNFIEIMLEKEQAFWNEMQAFKSSSPDHLLVSN